MNIGRKLTEDNHLSQSVFSEQYIIRQFHSGGLDSIGGFRKQSTTSQSYYETRNRPASSKACQRNEIIQIHLKANLSRCVSLSYFLYLKKNVCRPTEMGKKLKMHCGRMKNMSCSIYYTWAETSELRVSLQDAGAQPGRSWRASFAFTAGCYLRVHL